MGRPKNPEHVWTQEEDNLLTQYYQEWSKESLLAAIPGVSWIALRNHATHKLKLSRQDRTHRKVWSSSEEDQIVSMLKTMSVQKVADYFNVSYDKMEDKIHKMGYKAKDLRSESWTQEEDDILQEHFSYAPISYLKEKLPNRKWNSILQRGRKTFKMDRIAQDKTYLEYRVFDIWNEQTAYIFGFILADGYIKSKDYGSDSNILQISVHSRDVDIIYKIAAVLKYRGTISHIVSHGDGIKRKNDTPESSISCSNRWLINQLATKGMTMLDKSNTAVFPASVPQQYIRHLIRGIIDGDGWTSAKQIHDYDTFIVGVCGTYDVVSKIKENLPIDCSDIAIYQMTKTCFRWNIQGERAFKIAEWLYKDATIYLDRKYNEYCQAKQKYSPSQRRLCEDTQ